MQQGIFLVCFVEGDRNRVSAALEFTNVEISMGFEPFDTGSSH